MEQPGREDLLRWRRSKPTNFFSAVPAIAEALELRMGERFTDAMRQKLDSFGQVVASEIEPACSSQRAKPRVSEAAPLRRARSARRTD